MKFGAILTGLVVTGCRCMTPSGTRGPIYADFKAITKNKGGEAVIVVVDWHYANKFLPDRNKVVSELKCEPKPPQAMRLGESKGKVDICGCELGKAGWSRRRRPAGCSKESMKPKCGCAKGFVLLFLFLITSAFSHLLLIIF